MSDKQSELCPHGAAYGSCDRCQKFIDFFKPTGLESENAALRTRAEEAERKLADAHDAARREAVGICDSFDVHPDNGDPWNTGHQFACSDIRDAILARLGQPVEGQS